MSPTSRLGYGHDRTTAIEGCGRTPSGLDPTRELEHVQSYGHGRALRQTQPVGDGLRTDSGPYNRNMRRH